MTADEIKKLGQDATTKTWLEFKDQIQDPKLRKQAYDIVNYCWAGYKDMIPVIDTKEFWDHPVDWLKVYDIVRRLTEAYMDIYQDLWRNEFCAKYGREVAMP